MGRITTLVLYSLAFGLILEAMIVAAVLYWPNFEENLEAIRAMAGPIPMLRDFVDQLEETGVYGYVVGQHFFKGCSTLGTAAAVLFAAGAVAGEAHRGTLEILLARPYSRARILTERYFAGLVALAVPVALSTASIPWLVSRVGEEVELSTLLLGAAHEVIFLAPIYGAVFLLSTLGSNPTRIVLVGLFATTFMFAIYMIKVVTHYSLYRLADIEVFIAIEENGGLDWTICGPLLVATAILYAGSLAAFRRRVP